MNDSGIFRASQFHPSGVAISTVLPVDSDGGLELRALPPGTMLEVFTRNNTYVVIRQADGQVTIWGHPEYCPEPITVTGLGGSYKTGVFREGYLSPNMRLSFPLDGRRVSTSRIQALKLKKLH